MQRAIRNLDTGLFLAKDQWTAEAWLAEVFPNEAAVEQAVIKHKLRNAEMVYLDGDPPRVIGGVYIRAEN